MKTLGYGIIGCGRVSARHINTIEEGEGMRLAAIADTHIERAEQISAERPSRPAVYADYNDLLADENVDVAVICLPSQLHAEATIAAVDAGKHIYCEKVMAATLNEARAMIDAAETNGIKLNIGHNTRYFPPYAQAHRLIQDGQIGEVIAIDGAFPTSAMLPDTVRSTFWGIRAGARGHGMVMNFGCHYIDAARYLCGEEFSRVSACITNRYSRGQAPEDQYLITAVCQSGAIVTIAQYSQLTHIGSRNTGFMVYGSEGTLEVFYQPDHLAITRAGDEDSTAIEFDADIRTEGAWTRLHREFRQAIEDDTTPPVPGIEGYRNIEWALGAYLADEQRAWVALPLVEEYRDYAGPTLHESLPVSEP